MTHLKVGDTAPNFEGIDEKGEVLSLKHFAGKKLILYFYPKDNTPTCIVEACNLRDNYALLQAKGFEIVGISADDGKSHQKFITKQNLPFSLIADTDLTILKAYGVWGYKKFMGKEYDGIHRFTFVIDENGMIERIFDKVKSKTHSEQILESYTS